MAEFFAAADVGSNALRFQLAEVDEPGSYRIIEQEREPIRLGHQVFQTGLLSDESIQSALQALQRFKKSADRYRVREFKAVATSALREAANGEALIAKAQEAGVPLEVISGEEEARLISLGIMTGLRFDVPLGLFVDIGGGSLEVALANQTNTFCLFSLPLGAVRLTERFLKSDPPAQKEVQSLLRFLDDHLRATARRVKREKFTMAFGSGGTLTALAETDARLTGEARAGPLAVLRRSRLKGLLDLLQSQPLTQRASLIAGDPKRADIIIAGGLALLALLNHLELDYIFVSSRGLRDGLIADLLRSYYFDRDTRWNETGRPAETLEQVGEKYRYDAPHAYQVSHLALSLFHQLEDLHRLPEKDAGLLHAAAMLHDIGLFIAYPKHHKHSYYLIKSSGPSTFTKSDIDVIANIARYHRKAHPTPKHLPFAQLSPENKDRARKLSAILRIADGLDCSHESRAKELFCAQPKSRNVTIKVAGPGDLEAEITGARRKSKLLKEVFNVELIIHEDKR
jgi:exopolyphosphatase/guanosine-5'-triphosphate,3'-diphosphate pyrophosphatase